MTEFRTIDGSDNNPLDLGAAKTQLIRRFNLAYKDGFNEPRGGGISFDLSLPNPRNISNTIAAQTESAPNFLNASDWLWQWGQFIDHDLDLNEGGEESFSIPVNDSDDPLFPGPLPFTRVPAASGTGTDLNNPRQQNNDITSFIDASSVYGSEEERADFLRANDGTGKLKTTFGDNGEVLLPFNTDGLPNANPFGVDADTLFIAGDVRANEQIGLSAVHTLFVREHNLIAEDINQRLEAGETQLVEKLAEFEAEFLLENPGATSTEVMDEWVYQTARLVVGAEVQAITYNEFLPLLVGSEFTPVEGVGGGGFGVEPYSSYQPEIDPSVSNEFANAAYRLGHTLLNDNVYRIDEDGITGIPLGNPNDPSQAAFFNPDNVVENGVDSLLLGLSFQAAQDVDNFVVDGVRNFLFPAGTGGFDLASVNIQRGREVGIPGYVEVYNSLGLDNIFGDINDFDDLVDNELFTEEVANKFEQVYDDVDQIDLWIGGISEEPVNGGLLGPTFNLIVSAQFERTRDGDRFFYLDSDQLEHLEIIKPDIQNTTLADIIRENTPDDLIISDNPFAVPFENQILGTSSEDHLHGTNGDDLIEGLDGNDILKGKKGNDILFGGEGDDKLKGYQDDDTLYGGMGDDYLQGKEGNDSLLGGEGKDKLKGGYDDDLLIGGPGDDKLYGGKGDDILLGVGDDFGVGEIDFLKGGKDNDLLILGDENSVFYAGEGISDYAKIYDFKASEDTIQLHGDSNDYVLGQVNDPDLLEGTGLYLDLDNSGGVSGVDELIAISRKTISGFNSGFSFVS